MDSFLTEYLKEKNIFVVNYLDKIFNRQITTEQYIVYAVLLNAFAILALYRGGFTLFLMLFITSFYALFIAKINKKIKNDETRYVKLFGRMAVWLMFVSVFYFTYIIYEPFISIEISFVFLFALILCNINYSLKILNKIENKEFENNQDLNSFFIEKWANMFKYISKEKRNNIAKVVRFFDEQMIICLYIVILIYLNTKLMKRK
jgi:hypothetical protein